MFFFEENEEYDHVTIIPNKKPQFHLHMLVDEPVVKISQPVPGSFNNWLFTLIPVGTKGWVSIPHPGGNRQ